MSYYFLAQITIHDEAEYQKYIAGSSEAFLPYKGRYLAVDNEPLELEGKWEHERAVLIEFPSQEDFKDWYHSAAYQEILRHRLKAADCNTILIKGLEE